MPMTQSNTFRNICIAILLTAAFVAFAVAYSASSPLVLTQSMPAGGGADIDLAVEQAAEALAEWEADKLAADLAEMDGNAEQMGPLVVEALKDLAIFREAQEVLEQAGSLVEPDYLEHLSEVEAVMTLEAEDLLSKLSDLSISEYLKANQRFAEWLAGQN